MSQQYKAAIEAWSIFKNNCPFADWGAFINGWNAAIAYHDAQGVNQQMLEALKMVLERFVDSSGCFSDWENEPLDLARAAIAAAKEAGL